MIYSSNGYKNNVPLCLAEKFARKTGELGAALTGKPVLISGDRWLGGNTMGTAVRMAAIPSLFREGYHLYKIDGISEDGWGGKGSCTFYLSLGYFAAADARRIIDGFQSGQLNPTSERDNLCEWSTTKKRAPLLEFLAR